VEAAFAGGPERQVTVTEPSAPRRLPYCQEIARIDDIMKHHGQGLADVAHQVIGCHLTQ